MIKAVIPPNSCEHKKLKFEHRLMLFNETPPNLFNLQVVSIEFTWREDVEEVGINEDAVMMERCLGVR